MKRINQWDLKPDNRRAKNSDNGKHHKDRDVRDALAEDISEYADITNSVNNKIFHKGHLQGVRFDEDHENVNADKLWVFEWTLTTS